MYDYHLAPNRHKHSEASRSQDFAHLCPPSFGDIEQFSVSSKIYRVVFNIAISKHSLHICRITTGLKKKRVVISRLDSDARGFPAATQLDFNDRFTPHKQRDYKD